MSQSDERINQFLVYAYSVLNAHEAQISQMQNSVEAIEGFLKSRTGDYQGIREETLQRIALREQSHPAPGTLSTAETLAAMLKAIPTL